MPVYYTLPNAMKESALSRSTLYALLAKEVITARKAGRRLLIEAESLRQYIDNLPAAKFRAPVKKAAA